MIVTERSLPGLYAVAIAFVTVVTGMQLGCDQQAPQRPLVLGTCAVPASSAIHLAQGAGLLPGQAVEVRLFPSGRDALAALQAGEIDLATTSETPIVHSLLDGERPRILATLAVHQNMVSIVADREQGIASLHDLVGKRVGAAPRPNATFFIHGLLSFHQLPKDAIEVVALNNELALQALARGEIAALASWSPFRNQAQQVLGDRAVVISDPAVYSGTWNLVAAGDHRLGPERLQRLLKTLVDVSQTQLSAPSPVIMQSLSGWTGMDPGEIARSLQALRFDPRLDQSLLLLMEDQARVLDPEAEHLELLEAIDPSHIRTIDRGRITFVH
jgi:ABC-type nitrate/sulfonate/bicarbonate transport system substrate-binding protein